MMKKVLLLILVLVMLMVLAACNGDKDVTVTVTAPFFANYGGGSLLLYISSRKVRNPLDKPLIL